MTLPRHRILVSKGLMLMAASTIAFAQNAPGPQATDDYRLFVGIDVLIDHANEQTHLVENLEGNNAVIWSEHRQKIPLSAAKSLRYKLRPSIGRAPATIGNLKFEQATSYESDAIRQGHSKLIDLGQHASDAISRADGAVLNAQVGRGLAQGTAARNAEMQGLDPTVAGSSFGGGLGGTGPSSIDTGGKDFGHWAGNADSAPTSLGSYADTSLTAAGLGGARQQTLVNNILQVTFDVATPEPVADAYAVGIVSMVVNDEKTETLLFRRIGAVGPTPRRVNISRTTMPSGCQVEGVKIHLFSHGKEISTNMSEKNTRLNRDQAREFVLLAHIAEHPLETLPPEPVWTLAPPTLRATQDHAKFDQTVWVNIDADGTVLSVHESESTARSENETVFEELSLRQKNTSNKTFSGLTESLSSGVREQTGAVMTVGQVSPDIAALIDELIFKPALDSGQPVMGTTVVNLANYYR